jgi:hypothetical protein
MPRSTSPTCSLLQYLYFCTRKASTLSISKASKLWCVPHAHAPQHLSHLLLARRGPRHCALESGFARCREFVPDEVHISKASKLWCTSAVLHAAASYIYNAAKFVPECEHALVGDAAKALFCSQYLYFCTSKASKLSSCLNLSTRSSVMPRSPSSVVSICTFIPVKQVN